MLHYAFDRALWPDHRTPSPRHRLRSMETFSVVRGGSPPGPEGEGCLVQGVRLRAFSRFESEALVVERVAPSELVVRTGDEVVSIAGVDLADPSSVVLHLHRDATWDAIAEADATLAATAMAMAERYGYHADPRYHPQVKGRLTPRQRWRARVVAIGDACVNVGGDVRMSCCQRR